MTTLATISASQAGKELVANENFEAVSPAGLFANNYQTTSGLTFGFYGGTMLVDGVHTTIADGTVLLTASSTNRVEATRAGVVSANTSAFTAGRIPLYEAVTSTTTITTMTDRRFSIDYDWVGSFLSKAFSSDANITLSAAEARAKIIRLTGTISTVRDVFVPTQGVWMFHNNTSGSPSSAIRIIVAGSPSVGVTIAHGMHATVYADGTDTVWRASADVVQ